MKKRLLLFCLLASLGLTTSLQAQEEEVFRVAEEMPEYPGCEDIEQGAARLRCSRTKLKAYLESNLVYPAEAKSRGVQGTVVVSFIVNKDGSLADIKVLRDIGGGCAEAAEAVVNKMQADGIRWSPGKQRGIPVRVLFNLPVVFQLPKDTLVEEMMVEDRVEGDWVIADATPPPPQEKVFIPEEALRVMDEDEISIDVPRRPEVEEEPMNPRPVREEPLAPPPPPPPPPQITRDIFKVVEEMPRFYDAKCEALSSSSERKTCAEDKMFEYIYSHLEYPAVAKENEIEGTVVITYVVGKDGSLVDIRIIRDIGAGCGEEAARIVRSMNENGPSWIPGKQRGRAVRVQYNLPVKFRMD